MTAINKSKVTIISRTLISIFIVLFFFSFLIQCQEANTKMKKVSGTFKLTNQLLDTRSTYDQTEVRFVCARHILYSEDPDWDKAAVLGVRYYINPTNEGDHYRGCSTITYTNGDQMFYEYAGEWKWVVPRDGYKHNSETKGQLTGGTGKFKDVRGTIVIRGKGEVNIYKPGEWEVEYEIKATNN